MYILICDDEPAVARQVEQLARQHLEQRGIPVQCTVCTRGEEVLARTDLAQYQLALLDVDLETMTGIALGRRLKQQNPELVLVYISAYLEFAPEGYTVRAFRYLLKRDMERMLPSCLDAVLAEHSRECRTLPIRQGRRETEVPLDQIYYLESDLRKICLLYTSDAADEEDSVDLGGRRNIKKKQKQKIKEPQITRYPEVSLIDF